MVCIGLDEFTFSEVFDDQKVEDGKQLTKIGKKDLTSFGITKYFI